MSGFVGRGKPHGGKVDAKNYVCKKQKQFDGQHVEGTLQTIEKFSFLRNLGHLSNDEVIEWVKANTPLQVVPDDEGEMCVQIPDQGWGEKRYKVGRASEVSKIKQEQYKTKEMLGERFENMCQDFANTTPPPTLTKHMCEIIVFST